MKRRQPKPSHQLTVYQSLRKTMPPARQVHLDGKQAAKRRRIKRLDPSTTDTP